MAQVGGEPGVTTPVLQTAKYQLSCVSVAVPEKVTLEPAMTGSGLSVGLPENVGATLHEEPDDTDQPVLLPFVDVEFVAKMVVPLVLLE